MRSNGFNRNLGTDDHDHDHDVSINQMARGSITREQDGRTEFR